MYNLNKQKSFVPFSSFKTDGLHLPQSIPFHSIPFHSTLLTPPNEYSLQSLPDLELQNNNVLNTRFRFAFNLNLIDALSIKRESRIIRRYIYIYRCSVSSCISQHHPPKQSYLNKSFSISNNAMKRPSAPAASSSWKQYRVVSTPPPYSPSSLYHFRTSVPTHFLTLYTNPWCCFTASLPLLSPTDSSRHPLQW